MMDRICGLIRLIAQLDNITMQQEQVLAILVQLDAQHALAHSQPNAKSVTSQITITWTGLLASSALRGTILLVHLVYHVRVVALPVSLVL